MAVTSRARTWLLQSGLQQSNNALYQTILALLANIDELNSKLASSSSGGGGGGSNINNINNILNAFTSPSNLGEQGDMGPPGPVGKDGLNAQTIIIMMEEYNEEQVYRT